MLKRIIFTVVFLSFSPLSFSSADVLALREQVASTLHRVMTLSPDAFAVTTRDLEESRKLAAYGRTLSEAFCKGDIDVLPVLLKTLEDAAFKGHPTAIQDLEAMAKPLPSWRSSVVFRISHPEFLEWVKEKGTSIMKVWGEAKHSISHTSPHDDESKKGK